MLIALFMSVVKGVQWFRRGQGLTDSVINHISTMQLFLFYQTRIFNHYGLCNDKAFFSSVS